VAELTDRCVDDNIVGADAADVADDVGMSDARLLNWLSPVNEGWEVLDVLADELNSDEKDSLNENDDNDGRNEKNDESVDCVSIWGDGGL